VGGKRHAPAALPLPLLGIHCTGDWVGPGTVWTGAENLASTGIRSQDRTVHSESPYRLRYPGLATHAHTHVCVYRTTRCHVPEDGNIIIVVMRVQAKQLNLKQTPVVCV
jgi:hypothetical protein